jgi:hypothetical protein
LANKKKSVNFTIIEATSHPSLYTVQRSATRYVSNKQQEHESAASGEVAGNVTDKLKDVQCEPGDVSDVVQAIQCTASKLMPAMPKPSD